MPVDIEKILLAELLQHYGFLLTDRQREIAQLYYCNDLSLSEIAEILSVSKQAVGASLHTVKSELEQYEQHLHQLQLIRELSELRTELESISPQNPELDKLRGHVQEILDKF